METNNYFYINIIGQIESGWFPVGLAGAKLFCRYDIAVGPDWELVSGMTTGVTQCARAGSGRIDEIVFNMPLEVMYKSTNPYGWPQIVFSLYGTNWWGTETSRGYARVHCPLSNIADRKSSTTTIRAPILIAKCSNIWSSIASWFTDRNPELRDPKTLLDGNKSKGLLLESYGEIVVSLQSITRGGDKMSLDWGQRS